MDAPAKILVADDDRTIRRNLVKLLESGRLSSLRSIGRRWDAELHPLERT